MTATKVLLLFGGESTEHDISFLSVRNVAKALDPKRYDVEYCLIDREGKWWLVDGIVTQPGKKAAQLLPILGGGYFAVEASRKTIKPDVIFPVLHGRNGEDGSVQALAQLLHIPVVGCDMASSAVAMNKYLAKQIVMANGMAVAPFAVHYRGLMSFADLAPQLGETLFVKPANAGSSVGVSRVTDQAELEKALEEAHQHDEIVLIEKAIDARELEVAVLGNFPEIQASVVAEIKPQGEFYSYDSKYDDETTSEAVIPADIPQELSDRIRQDALSAFRLLGCRGMARVDFFVDRHSGEVYFNEVNTIPGFTDISVYPKAWEKTELPTEQLLDRLITLALDVK